MENTIRVRKFIFSDTKANSNKFWNVHVYDNNKWRAHYGRVGTDGAWANPKPNSTLSGKIAEKLRKGYVEIQQATSEEKNTFSTPVGLVSLSAARKALEISERICATTYTDPNVFGLYSEYMKILPINIGMRSDSWVIYRQIKRRHPILKDLIDAADADQSDALLGNLVDLFFSEMEI